MNKSFVDVLAFLASYQRQYIRNFILAELSRIAGSKIDTKRQAISLLQSPEMSTRFTLYYFTFARAGAEAAGYDELSLEMFERVKGNDLKTTWRAFQELCEREGIGPNEKLNRPPIEGLMRIYFRTRHGGRGLFPTIATEVERTGSLAQSYVDLMTVARLGEKRAAFLLRDLAWIWDLEGRATPASLMFLQPIDVWVREAARTVLNDGLDDHVPSLAVAHLLSEACLNAKVSGVAFNQGAWFFGSQVVKERSAYRRKLRREFEKSPNAICRVL